MLSRRRVVFGALAAGSFGVLAACGKRSDPASQYTSEPQGTASAGTGGVAGGSGAGGAATPKAVPSWRGVNEIPLEPDSPSRGFAQTSPAGDRVEADSGLSVAVPSGSKVTRRTNDYGAPETVVELPGAENGFPRLLVDYVESFGRPLVAETHAQEVFLAVEKARSSYVLRTREQWPGADEAFVMTWSTSVTLPDWTEVPMDAAGMWLGNGSGGGWVMTATAPAGELAEGRPLWDTLFSARLPS